MITERHMPSLHGSLPFIDHAAQMRIRDITETYVEIEAEPYVETNTRTNKLPMKIFNCSSKG